MVTFHLLIKTSMYLYEPQMIFTESQTFLLHLHVGKFCSYREKFERNKKAEDCVWK